MNNNKTTIKNQKGFTIFELMVSIVVGTIIISILMQQLAMVVVVKRDFEYDNRLANESYYIAEQIKYNIFELQPHEIEFVEDTATQTVIRIHHRYDITSGAGNVIERDCINETYDELIWDKVNHRLTYNGQTFHASNIKVGDNSVLSVLPLDEAYCLANPPSTDWCAVGITGVSPEEEVCYQGILRLELELYIEFDGEEPLEPQIFVFTIIV